MNFTCLFLFLLNVAARELKITHEACIPFLLDITGLDNYLAI